MGAAAVAGLAASSVAFGHPESAEPPPPPLLIRPVLVDDAGVHMPKDQFTRRGVPRYPKGTQIRYEFKNVGSKPYAVFLWGADTTVMRPHGGRASMLVNYTWAQPGTYLYYRTYRGRKIAPVGRIIVFDP